MQSGGGGSGGGGAARLRDDGFGQVLWLPLPALLLQGQGFKLICGRGLRLVGGMMVQLDFGGRWSMLNGKGDGADGGAALCMPMAGVVVKVNGSTSATP